MIRQANSVEDWLEENHKEMIDCPYQPGCLKISKASCKRRFLASLYVGDLSGDPMLYGVKKGLLLCGECPIAKKLAGKGKNKLREESDASGEGKFFLRRFPYGSFRKIREGQHWKTGGGRAGLYPSRQG
jgi:hypothetical protein